MDGIKFVAKPADAIIDSLRLFKDEGLVDGVWNDFTHVQLTREQCQQLVEEFDSIKEDLTTIRLLYDAEKGERERWYEKYMSATKHPPM